MLMNRFDNNQKSVSVSRFWETSKETSVPVRNTIYVPNLVEIIFHYTYALNINA